MDVPTVYTVEVPMTSDDRTGHGYHVFTGHAANAHQALTAARAAWSRAHDHLAAGHDVPRATGTHWCARAVRPGWTLDWDRADARMRTLFSFDTVAAW
ncbi:hypothetical protein AB0N09_40745 [Streptomyces erythrochromogenes]|uniref:hypothetical protein n=1 Tax=Streptomyces erythrochromogenes TaxID=285574 RepID=UPI003415E86D